MNSSLRCESVIFSAACAAVNSDEEIERCLDHFSAACAAVNPHVGDAERALNFSAACAAVNCLCFREKV